MPEGNRPEGRISGRPLHFFWIVDCSGSMVGEKINELNYAIQSAIPAMRDAAKDNPHAKVMVRVVKFADTAEWHVGQPTPVDSFTWSALTADGTTAMGKALGLVAEHLKMPPMETRALPPVLVLVTDGQPTDDFSAGLTALMAEPWGKKAMRLAIAIGRDADLECLQKFVGNSEIKPLQANNAEDLVKFIRWASTSVVKQASSPAAAPASPGGGSAPPPIPVLQDAPDPSGNDVW